VYGVKLHICINVHKRPRVCMCVYINETNDTPLVCWYISIKFKAKRGSIKNYLKPYVYHEDPIGGTHTATKVLARHGIPFRV